MGDRSRRVRAGVARVAGILVVATAAVTAPACSSDGTSRLTEREVVREANAICARTNRAIAAMNRPVPDDPVASAAALEQVTRRQRAALQQLRTLAPPEADASDFGRWLTQIDLALDRAEASSAAIAAGDVVAAEEANGRGEQIRTDADRFADRYGLDRCAQPR